MKKNQSELEILKKKLAARKNKASLVTTYKPNSLNYHILESYWNSAEQIGHETFGFVLDLDSFKIKYSKGTYKNLGIFEKDFKIENYFEGIHPTHSTFWWENTKVLFQNLCEGNIVAQEQVVSLESFRRQNGDFLYVKRLSRPFEFDKNGNMLSYLYVFIVIGKFEGQPFEVKTESSLSQCHKNNSPKSELPFTRKERIILLAYANDKNLTANLLANQLNISYNTVITHKNNALSKARKFLSLEVATVRVLADMLRDLGLI